MTKSELIGLVCSIAVIATVGPKVGPQLWSKLVSKSVGDSHPAVPESFEDSVYSKIDKFTNKWCESGHDRDSSLLSEVDQARLANERSNDFDKIQMAMAKLPDGRDLRQDVPHPDRVVRAYFERWRSSRCEPRPNKKESLRHGPPRLESPDYLDTEATETKLRNLTKSVRIATIGMAGDWFVVEYGFTAAELDRLESPLQILASAGDRAHLAALNLSHNLFEPYGRLRNDSISAFEESGHAFSAVFPRTRSFLSLTAVPRETLEFCSTPTSLADVTPGTGDGYNDVFGMCLVKSVPGVAK